MFRPLPYRSLGLLTREGTEMIRSRRFNPSIDMFRRMPLFDGCRRRELELLGRVADEVLLPAGRVLIRQGEVARDCFILIDGEAEILVDGLPVGCVGAPTLIGAESLRRRTRRTGSVVATVPTRAFSFGEPGFRQLMSLPLVAERVLGARATSPECLLCTPLLPRTMGRNTAPLVVAR